MKLPYETCVPTFTNSIIVHSSSIILLLLWMTLLAPVSGTALDRFLQIEVLLSLRTKSEFPPFSFKLRLSPEYSSSVEIPYVNMKQRCMYELLLQGFLLYIGLYFPFVKTSICFDLSLEAA